MNILGLSYMYHDSSACLVRDGRVLAAAAEERFIRIKHSIDFPVRAINYCLSEGGLSVGDLDAVVFYEKPFLKFERILKTHLEVFPRSYRSFRAFLPMWLDHKLCVPQTIRETTGYKGPIYFTDHHYAHAASSFLMSPFERAIVLTMDGTGEWSTLAYGVGEGTGIRLEKDLRFPHSLGLLYSAVTAHLGFKVNGGEGKVMGLAAYGKPSVFEKKFAGLIERGPDGGFRLDMKYFAFHYDLVMTSREFSKLFFPPRAAGEELRPEHADLAAALQAAVEEIVLGLVRRLCAEYGLDSLCLSGGCALNCVANGLILEKTPVKRIFVQPAAGDDGCSAGSALYVYTRLFGGRERYAMRDAFLGPSFTDGEVEARLKSCGADYEVLPAEAVPLRGAELLSKGSILGWFQGRMEFGPRALGNRSILADPRDPGMKDTLNRRVKHREPFRPFAPAVCLENAREYFELRHESPFMTLSFPVKAEKRAVIPAVTHVDGSARVQTVAEAENPLFYGLIKEFGALTGVPVVLNTSFNIQGEPIVCTPQDAISSFMRSDMDHLIINRFLVKKAGSRA